MVSKRAIYTSVMFLKMLCLENVWLLSTKRQLKIHHLYFCMSKMCCFFPGKSLSKRQAGRVLAKSLNATLHTSLNTYHYVYIIITPDLNPFMEF